MKTDKSVNHQEAGNVKMLIDGAVQISGPITDRVVAYGILECARDAIREFHEKQRSGRVAVVGASEMPKKHH